MKIQFLMMLASPFALAGSPAAQVVSDDRPVIVKAIPDDANPSRRIFFADLDLTTPGGTKSLHQRVGQAVGKVCLEATGPNPLGWAESSCKKEAWRGAKPQMERAILRAHELAEGGTSAIAPVAISISVASR